jgi:hypothetical protein
MRPASPTEDLMLSWQNIKIKTNLNNEIYGLSAKSPMALICTVMPGLVPGIHAFL